MVLSDYILDDVSYIIGYRESTPERREALIFVLKWLSNYLSGIEILIVEQDDEPRLDLLLPVNCRKIFLYNPGLYNRSWAFNVAVKNTEKNIFAFSDADIVLHKKDYLACFEACREYEVVTPNAVEAVNITELDYETLSFQETDTRNIWTFSSMLEIIRRDGFEKIVGWDERFEGWGGEDNAHSHVIFQILTNKSFSFPIYHIDHPRSELDGNSQPNYTYNFNISEEIYTLNGPAIKRYLHRLDHANVGDPEKYRLQESSENKSPTPHFILAVTTYNRIEYLKQLIDSWLSSRTDTAKWQLLIADDGSTDGTMEYIQSLDLNEVPVHIIQNNRRDINHQTNSIIKFLSERNFDICFMCNDDIVFKKSGWDLLYWDTVQRTGYDHLCFYDRRWHVPHNFDQPVTKGGLQCHCEPIHLQGAFYTITPEVIAKVGFFDINHFGFRGFEHVDYSFRCCRAGFNVLKTPFDVVDSNSYLGLQERDGYLHSISSDLKHYISSGKSLLEKKDTVLSNRLFIPYNEHAINLDEYTSKEKVRNGLDDIALERKRRNQTIYQLADDKMYKGRGFMGIIGSLVKKIYNFHIRHKWMWFPRCIKAIGRIFSKAGEDLVNIDRK